MGNRFLHGRRIGTEVRVIVHDGVWRHWVGWVHGDGVESRKGHVDMSRHGGAIEGGFRTGGRDRRRHGHDGLIDRE